MSALFGPKLALARATGALSRRSGRGGGTTLPGRLLLRLAPDAIARLGSRLDGGSIDRQRDQRQDDHRRDDRRRPRAAGREPVHNRAGSNMTWGVATALLEQSGERGPVRGRRGLAAAGRGELDPRLIVLGNLFRDQLDRYGELERLADDWAELVAARAGQHRLRAQRRRPAGRRPRPRPRAERAAPASPTSGSRTPARRCPSSSTPTTPSTAAAAARRTSTSAPSSATSATTRCPSCDADRPRPTSPRPRIELEGMSRLARRRRDARGRARARASPSPASTTSTTRSPRVTAALRSGIPLDQIRRGLESMEAVFGRVETIEVGGQAGLDPADQEPGRRQRGPAHAAARGRAATAARPLDRAQRPHRRRPRRLLDLGRRLRAARRPRAPGRLRRHAGARDGGAAQVRGLAPDAIEVEEAIDRSLDARSPGRPAASSPCPPTRRCSSCARCSPTAAWRGSTGHEPGSRGVEEAVWHDVEYGSYAADLALWAELAAAAAARCSSSAAGRAASRCTSPARASRSGAVDARGELIAALQRERAAARGPSLRPICADAGADWTLGRRELRRSRRADAALQMLGADGARRRCSRRSQRLSPAGALAAVVARRRGLAARRRPEGGPLPDVRERRRLGLLEPAARRAARRAWRLDVARLRQSVSPSGELSERVHDDVLHAPRRRAARGRGRAAGLGPPAGARSSGPTDDHSVVVIAVAGA